MRVKRAISGVSLFLCVFGLVAGCNDNFQPLKENTLYNFNISGYLDASADTQWVRVGTIRESIDEPPNPTGIEVTLEDLQSGESVMMNDSVFTSKNVLNYWTTTDIENERTYQLRVSGTQKKTSQVTVTTPSKIPKVYITTFSESSTTGGEASSGANIYINDSAENIADIQSVWYIRFTNGTKTFRSIYRFPIRHTLKHTSSFYGSYVAYANVGKQLKQISLSAGNSEFTVARKQIFVALGGPEWDPNISTINNLEYFLDGTGSNVKNGLGYVLGISSGWYKQETCLNADESGYASCPKEDPFW